MIAHPVETAARLAFVDRLAGGPMTWIAPDGLTHPVAGASVDPADRAGEYLLFTACGRWDLPEGIVPASGRRSMTCPACGTAVNALQLSRTRH